MIQTSYQQQQDDVTQDSDGGRRTISSIYNVAKIYFNNSNLVSAFFSFYFSVQRQTTTRYIYFCQIVQKNTIS